MGDPTPARPVVLGGAGNPAMELVDLGSGERLLLPIAPRGSFSKALPRQGWTAVHIDYDVLAIPHGGLFRPVVLPPVWQLAPASTADLVALRVHEARSRRAQGEGSVLVVDRHGEVVRSAHIPMQALVGELGDGSFVARDGWWSSDGTQREGLPEGTPVGVVAAWTVVIWQAAAAGRGETPSTILTFDVRTGSTASIQVPFPYGSLSPRYTADASRLAVLGHHVPGALVVGHGQAPRWWDLPGGSTSPAWMDDEHLLFVTDSSVHVLDVGTGGIETICPRPRYLWPECVVTGLFDIDEVRARIARPAEVPMTPARWEASLAAERERLRAIADGVGLHAAFVEAAEPSIRLRTWPAEITAPGTSRLGGRPDRPRGRPWPTGAGRPMAFLVQLDLAEIATCLPATGLPRTGVLQVFAAIEPDGMYPVEDDAVNVSIVDGGLHRAAWPRSLPEELRFSPADIGLEPTLGLPSWGHPTYDAQPTDAMDRFHEASDVPDTAHRMFGLPDAVQRWQPTPGRVLLLQIDGDAHAQIGFGDGYLRVWAPVTPQGRITVGPDGVIEGCTVDLDRG